MKIAKNMSASCILIFACFISAIFTPVLGEAGEPVQQRIQKAYKSMLDLQGEFSQLSRIRELDETKTARGRFYIQRPNRVRWDYLEPAKQTVVIIDNEMFLWQEGNTEIMKRKLDPKSYGQTPIALLSGLGDMERDFVVKPDGPQAVLLVPRSDMGIVQSIRVETTKSQFPIQSLQIIDIYGNVNIFTFKHLEMNKGLGDDIFERPIKVFTDAKKTP